MLGVRFVSVRSRARGLWLLAVAAAALSGCAAFWESVRERERGFATEHARELVARGRCEDALPSLERSQAKPELGAYAVESSVLKARCLERLGRREEALAHYRFLRDHHPESFEARGLDQALPRDDAARLGTRPASTRGLLELPEVRYSQSAERSDLTGSVRVEYLIGSAGHTRQIRVVDPAHPLLASWAIEATAAAAVPERSLDRVRDPIHGMTRFEFRTRWQGVDDPATPETPATGQASGEDPWEIEWFPGSDR